MRRTWYLLCLVPLAICGVIAGVLAYKLHSDVADMKRVVMPGEHVLQLAPGDYVAYAETNSNVDGEVLHASSFSLRCTMMGQGGEVVGLRSPTARSSYSVGPYAGEAIYIVTILRSGSYTFACAGDQGASSRVAIALGPGIGATIATIAALVLGGFIAAVFGFILVRRRRKQWLAVQRSAQPASPATTGS